METLEKYKPIFDYFCNKDHWKNPINKIISYERMERENWSLEDIEKSIEFYTATTPIFHRVIIEKPEDIFSLGYSVQSIGYRMGEAGDQ